MQEKGEFLFDILFFQEVVSPETPLIILHTADLRIVCMDYIITSVYSSISARHFDPTVCMFLFSA